MEQRVLGGRYLLKDKVGTGGMATVFRAQDQVLDRTVAVKIMLPQYAGDATFAARFKQEAQAAAGLSSPYIVGVYDWGKDGDTYYIVMEYLRGTDLKSGIKSHGALDPKKVAQIGNTAEAEAGGQNARALKDALVDAVANLDTKAADLADGGEAVGEAVVGLLDGDGLLLEERLHDPIGVMCHFYVY